MAGELRDLVGSELGEGRELREGRELKQEGELAAAPDTLPTPMGAPGS